MARVAHNKGQYRNREQRTCVICGKRFWFRLCYAKRPHRTGLCCSSGCRAKYHIKENNPNAGPFVKYGSKRVQHEKQLRHYAQLRLDALTRIARIHATTMACFGCECSLLAVLHVNHVQGRQRKTEIGATLWRRVLQATDEEVKQQFDIRCIVCNWAHFATQKYGVVWEIHSRKEPKNNG